MKRIFAFLLCMALCAGMAAGALADGVTLRTVSTFAGTDAGAQAYVDLLAEWEALTGNRVEDSSATSDETWKRRMTDDFDAGNEPDVFFYFAVTADSRSILDKVVPISEIKAAYPEYELVEDEKLREADGNVYAIDVRPFWEGLFVNTDMFEAYGLELPTDVGKFERAVAVFQENDVIPIGISLSDIPHYIVEMAILSSGTVADHQARPTTPEEIPASWAQGMELIHHLYDIGAFPKNVNATSEDLTTAMFLSKRAAMLLDGSWRANGVSQEHWDTTIVMPFPAYGEEADPKAIIGGTSMGFYLSRRAWEDEAKREAAVSLLAHLTSPEAKRRLDFLYGGALLESALKMTEEAVAADVQAFPIGDVMDTDARNFWFGQIPAIADGSADPWTVLEETINRGAF